ncbi:MAG: NosD domain-containing protein [Actinomycetota bacterium]
MTASDVMADRADGTDGTDRVPEPASRRVPVRGVRLAVRRALGGVAALLCLVAIPLPLWSARLEAPQYHGDGALRLTAYGDRLVGDVCEINDLNHYIGMRRLGEPRVPCGSAELGLGENTVGRIAPEMILWLPSAVLAAAAVYFAAVTTRRWLRRGALVFAWGLPVGVLVMTQYHLYTYGHDLDPAAAFHPDPFTPRVLGPSKIYQFDVVAKPGAALLLIVAAAMLATFGSMVVKRYFPRFTVAARSSSARAALSLTLVLIPVTLSPGGADNGGSDIDHTNHTDQVAAEAATQSGVELTARLAAAHAGETLVVAAGEYRGNFVIRVPLTLRGDGMPVLDGGGRGTVLTVTPEAAGTTLSGLRLVGSGPGPLETPAGLLVAADGVTVEGVEVADSYMGIQVMGVRDVSLIGNQIASFESGGVEGEMHATGGAADATGLAPMNHESSSTRMRGDAITLWNSVGTLVEGNTISNTRDGIYMSFADAATLRDNDVRDSRYAIHGMYATDLVADHNYFDGNLAGAVLMYGGPFDLRRNSILNSRSVSTGIGIVIKDGAGATIIENVIVANRVGVKLDNGGATSSASSPATVRSNTIGLNQVGVEIMQASRGRFTRNSFVENTMQVIADGEIPNIEWTDAGFGNYWSTYRGYDTAGDGLGDVAFVQGGSIAQTLVRSPVMIALASGPAFRLLQAVEDRWAPEAPVVLDRYPLIAMQSPALGRTRSTEPAPRWFGIAGGTVAVLALLVLWRARSTRPEVRHA